jgi:hypothetical protein
MVVTNVGNGCFQVCDFHHTTCLLEPQNCTGNNEARHGGSGDKLRMVRFDRFGYPRRHFGGVWSHTVREAVPV